MSLYSLSQQANMDFVNSYWLNWIKWNEYCDDDSIEIVRSVFIWNMWFVDSSMKNQSCIVKIQSKNGFNKHKEGKYHSIWIQSTIHSHSKNKIGVWMVIIQCWFHTDLHYCDWLIWISTIIWRRLLCNTVQW